VLIGFESEDDAFDASGRKRPSLFSTHRVEAARLRAGKGLRLADIA
jgi:hypothetical protein